MKTQMRFQKYICLVMILVGVVALLYAFAYCTGAVADLGHAIALQDGKKVSTLENVAEGKYDSMFYYDIQPFNNILMYCGIAMILLGVILYITACQKRRKYYVSNYVATGLCAVGNIVMAIVLMVYNTFWKSEFLNVDFVAWKAKYQMYFDMVENGNEGAKSYIYYNDSTIMFDLGYAVFALVIVASLLLIFNLVWKILLMNGEKKLLSGSQLAGGETV